MIGISQKLVGPLVLATNSSDVAASVDADFTKMRGIIRHSLPPPLDHPIPINSVDFDNELLIHILRLLCKVVRCGPEIPPWPLDPLKDISPAIALDQIRGWANGTTAIRPIASPDIQTGVIDSAVLTNFTAAVTDVVCIWRAVVDSEPKGLPWAAARRSTVAALAGREVTGEDVAVVAAAVAYALLEALPYLILL